MPMMFGMNLGTMHGGELDMMKTKKVNMEDT
jgi:hypothetical protein